MAPPSKASLAVSEIFGPTLQGEGPSSGRRAMFLRLAGCNLSCSWCDTAYTWDWSRYDKKAEVTMMQVDNGLPAHHAGVGAPARNHRR